MNIPKKIKTHFPERSNGFYADANDFVFLNPPLHCVRLCSKFQMLKTDLPSEIKLKTTFSIHQNESNRSN
jgi:hypothetical protein